MIKEFQFDFFDLGIKVDEVAEFMGIVDTDENPFSEIIESALDEALDLVHIKCGFRIVDDVFVDNEKGCITLEKKQFSTGKIVTTQLKNSAQAAIIAGTAGAEIYTRAQELINSGDLMTGYVFDTIGSLAASRSIDLLSNKIREWAIARQMAVSDHFSPGYCDWSVSEQKLLFSLLPIHFCGITLNDSFLMDPVKSVSAITGIGVGLSERGYQCFWCKDDKCHFGVINRKKRNKKIS